MRKIIGFFGVLIGLCLILILGAFFLNKTVNDNPAKENVYVTIPTLNSALEKQRFLHISDLNSELFGENQEALQKLIEGERFSAVFFTGDMVGKKGDTSGFAKLISLFPKDTPMYFISGDDDPEVYQGGDYAPWIKYFISLGVKYLDAPESLQIGRAKVWLCPFDMLIMDLKTSKLSYQQTIENAKTDSSLSDAAKLAKKRLEAIEKAEMAQMEMLSSDTYICLSHIPLSESDLSFIHNSDEERKLNNFPGIISLVLSGHFNNGQAYLPFIGRLFTPEHELTKEANELARKENLSGVIYIRGVAQHISPGLSTSSIYPSWSTFRLFNKPAISYIILTQDLK